MDTFIARNDYPVIDARKECRLPADPFTGNPVCPIADRTPIFRSVLLTFVTGSVNRAATRSVSARSAIHVGRRSQSSTARRLDGSTTRRAPGPTINSPYRETHPPLSPETWCSTGTIPVFGVEGLPTAPVDPVYRSEDARISPETRCSIRRPRFRRRVWGPSGDRRRAFTSRKREGPNRSPETRCPNRSGGRRNDGYRTEERL